MKFYLSNKNSRMVKNVGVFHVCCYIGTLLSIYVEFHHNSYYSGGSLQMQNPKIAKKVDVTLPFRQFKLVFPSTFFHFLPTPTPTLPIYHYHFSSSNTLLIFPASNPKPKCISNIIATLSGIDISSFSTISLIVKAFVLPSLISLRTISLLPFSSLFMLSIPHLVSLKVFYLSVTGLLLVRYLSYLYYHSINYIYLCIQYFKCFYFDFLSFV